MIEITTLGNFEISINGNIVTERFKNTTKLLRMMNILLLNRGKPVPIGQIIDKIWEDIDADSAAKALHNLVYRFRGIFATHGEPNCIVFNNRSYMLNAACDWRVDIHKMEDYVFEASKPSMDTNAKIDALNKAVDLYNGEYILSMISEDVEALYMTNRYKRLFSDAICMLADLYMAIGRHDVVIRLCEKGILFEPLDEHIMMRMVQSLRKLGRDMQAVGLMENYCEHLYRETGMQPPDSINGIYKSLKKREGAQKTGVSRVANELREISSLDKSLFCPFETFRDIYRYETRQNVRREYTILLVLAEVHGSNKNEMSEKALATAIRAFHESCMRTLRKGDMFADYSQSQIIIMLTVHKDSNADAIMERLRDTFYSIMKGEQVFVSMEKHFIMDD